MVTVLIAHGTNGLKIPCRIFSDMGTGKAVCDEIFEGKGRKPPEVMDKSVMYYVDAEDEDKELSETLFTDYYYGCGGPGPFELKEVEFNTKFVGFDLD
jgi:hypothetical protein